MILIRTKIRITIQLTKRKAEIFCFSASTSIIYSIFAKKKVIIMRKMLQTLKSYFDRRLRERCVKYASRSCQGTDRDVIYEVQRLYSFIKGKF